MNMKKFAANALWIFVWISVGYALGSSAARRAGTSAEASGTEGSPQSSASADRSGVDVIFLHGTIRCVTCTRIETLARTLIEQDFADAMAAGRVTWRTANFQVESNLATRYDVGASTLIMARMQDGREVEFRRLDDVWTTIHDEAAFKAYIESELRELLMEPQS